MLAFLANFVLNRLKGFYFIIFIEIHFSVHFVRIVSPVLSKGRQYWSCMSALFSPLPKCRVTVLTCVSHCSKAASQVAQDMNSKKYTPPSQGQCLLVCFFGFLVLMVFLIIDQLIIGFSALPLCEQLISR